MSYSEILLPEFDQEMASTRKVLERVPYEKGAWKPHEKSMALGHLTGHVVEMLTWAPTIITSDELDLGKSDYKPFVPASKEEALAKFDELEKGARASLGGASDAEYAKPWSLKMNGQTLFTMPKAAVIRSMVMNHIIHHRAQLSVYLRLQDVPVPGLYGPSADEQFAVGA